MSAAEHELEDLAVAADAAGADARGGADDAPRAAHAPPPYGQLFAMQFSAMLLKNLYLTRSRPASTLAMILAPLLMFAIASPSRQALIDSLASKTVSFEYAIPECQIYKANGERDQRAPQGECVSLLYAPTSADNDAIIAHFSAATGLAVGDDILGFDDLDAAIARVYDRPGYAPYVVHFHAIPPTAFDANSTDTVTFDLYMNDTTAFSQKGDIYLFQPQTVSFALQSAISGHLLEQAYPNAATADPAINVVVEELESESPTADFDSGTFLIPTILIQSANLFQVCVCVVALLTLNHEHVEGITAAMRRIGLLDSVYLISWSITFFVISFLSSLITTLVGNFSGYWVYSRCDASIHIVLLTTTLWAFCSLALFCSTLVHARKWTYLVAVLLFLLSQIIVSIFSNSDTNTASIFDDQMYGLASNGAGQFFYFFMPWMHYGRALSIIFRTTHYKGAVLPPQHMSWSDFSRDIDYVYFDAFGEQKWTADSGADAIGFLILLSLVYQVLAWYVAQVKVGAAGTGLPFTFPFNPVYWGLASPPSETSGISVDAVRAESRQNMEIRTHKLSKTFENATAFKELSMNFRSGQVAMLLGSNGAGKTTFINVITGLMPASAGDAFILGLDIKTDLAKIRPLMAIDPQHDVLWPDLTARQHLKVYGLLKGGRGADLHNEIDGMLKEVSLHKQAGVPAGKFSGGMKRRLSLGLAFMGESRIVYLDEPTTGLDPINRRRCWKLINKRKAGRIVVMTTHDLNEADSLGDTVAILASGRLRALGTPVFLKSHFGSGFQIQLLCKPERVDDVQKIVSRALPGSEIISSSAGNITVALTKSGIHNLRRFFQCLERRYGIVREWGISNSTLEEVFLRVASTDSSYNNAPVSEEAMQRIQICVECRERNAEMVTLFASSGVRVQSDQLLCVRCATDGPPGEIKDAQDSDPAAPAGDDFPIDLEDIPIVADAENAQDEAQKDRADYAEHRKAEFHKQLPERVTVSNASMLDLARSRFAAIMHKNTLVVARQRRTIAAQLIIVLFFLGLYAALFSPKGGGGFAATTCEDEGFGDFDPITNPLEICDGGFVQCESSCDLDEFTRIFRYGESSQTGQVWDGNDAGYCVLYESPDATLTPGEVTDFDNVRCIQYEQFDSEFESEQNPFGAARWRRAADTYGSSISFSPTTVWYSDAPGDFLIEDFDPLGLGIGVLNSTNIRLVPVDSVTAKYETSQLESIANAEPLLAVCPNANLPSVSDDQEDDEELSFAAGTEDFVWYIDDPDQAIATFRDRFPDIGIEFELVDPLAQRLAYKLRVPIRGDAPGSIYTSNLPTFASPAGPVYYDDDDDQGESPDYYYTPYNPYYIGETDCVVYEPSGEADVGGIARVLLDMNFAAGVRVAATNSSAPLADVKVRGLIRPMPRFHFARPKADEDTISTQVLFLGYATVIWFPAFAAILAQEKYSGLLHIIQSTGISFPAYALFNYIFGMIYLVLIHIVIAIFGFATGMNGFNDWALFPYWVLLFIVWGHVQIGLSFFLAGFAGSQRMATMVGYVIAILTVSASSVLEALNGAYAQEAAIFGPLAYLHGAALIIRDGADLTTSLSSMLAFGLLGGTILLVPGLLALNLDPELKLSEVLSPRKLLHRSFSRRSSAAIIPINGSQQDTAEAALPLERGFVDEENKISAELVAESAPNGVIIDRLVKVFEGPTPKYAVNKLSLNIAPAECLALLAPNGGGKSTTINMLVGLLHPTEGTATVCGHPLGSKAAIERLGRCPQFDVVWDDLTVREHFAFFARMRGISAVRETCYKVAEQVLLDGDPFGQKATTLSGGMKRRLSIGISLVGDPSVLLLDEPTTGVSPELRHGIWEIIERERENGRAILLTTHSMEEASTLASRVAIASLGRLISVGTPLELKNRIGGVFKLLVAISPEGSADKTTQFVRESICDEAVEVHDTAVGHHGQLEYALPRDKVDVATVFEQMETNRNALNINEWNFGLTSLDEVFVKVVERDEADF